MEFFEYRNFTKKSRCGSKKEIISPEVVAAVDRSTASSENAMLIISAALNAAGENIDDYKLSSSTINNRRHQHRATIDHRIRTTFKFDDHFLSVHYDEKKLKDYTGGNARRNVPVNRLAVATSFTSGYKLLDIPKINDGTGKTIADSVIDVLRQWNLSDKVRALSCDTTASNTDERKGSAYRLEKLLGRPLLFTFCRHHVAEVLLKKAFSLTVEPKSTGPDVELFGRFQKAWQHIKIDAETIYSNSAHSVVK